MNNIFEENNNDGLKAAVGFDGFVDKIYRPVKNVKNKDKVYYNKIDEFGNRIKKAAGLSCDIDIELETIQPGGNTPLFANSLGHLGIKTDCMAPIDEYEDIFKTYMSKNCKIRSVGEPGLSFVLEFLDGKVMLGDTHTFKDINWQRIKKRVGKHIFTILKDYELISMVNWSHFDNMSQIWSHIINYLKRKEFKHKGQSLFIDLADTSARNYQDLVEMFNILHKFTKFYNVTLGLNENETKDLGIKLLSDNYDDLNEVGSYLIDNEYVDEVVIHPVASAILIDEKKTFTVKVPKVKNPVLTVGGGDNFNAGYSWGKLNKLSPEKCLILGAVNARLFVSNGKSPSINDVFQYLIKAKDNIEVNYHKKR